MTVFVPKESPRWDSRPWEVLEQVGPGSYHVGSCLVLLYVCGVGIYPRGETWGWRLSVSWTSWIIMWDITVDGVFKSICEINWMHKKDSVISICCRSGYPVWSPDQQHQPCSGTSLKRQLLCHIPDLLNENLWEVAQSSPFYQSSHGDSDAPQHSRVTITEYPHKAINHENPETTVYVFGGYPNRP